MTSVMGEPRRRLGRKHPRRAVPPSPAPGKSRLLTKRAAAR